MMSQHPKAEKMLSLLSDFYGDSIIEVYDESHMHHGRAGTESHFRVLIITPKFQDLSRIERHRQVNEILSELISQIHALALSLFTEEEWKKRGMKKPESPVCVNSKAKRI